MKSPEQIPLPEQIPTENIEKEEKVDKEDLVNDLASLAHDDWRAPRKIEGKDSYEPRIKKVRDKEWIERHEGKTEVDIANTPYSELPKEWQAENKASADIAMNEVIKAGEGHNPFDEKFVEHVADLLHQGWLECQGGLV